MAPNTWLDTELAMRSMIKIILKGELVTNECSRNCIMRVSMVVKIQESHHDDVRLIFCYFKLLL